MTSTPLRRSLLGAAVLVTLAGLAACSSPAAETTASSSDGSSSTTSSSAASTQPAPDETRSPVAITHIHAVARDAKTDDLLLATHQGLVRQVGGELHQIGPGIDLMGFAVAPDGTYYASGHPGTGVELPQPVGLITSTDSGRTWQVASRGGESDFHALTVGPKSVTGFDGALRTTTDRKTWTTRAIPAQPRALAAAPASGALLATTSAGLLLSTDDGNSWRTLTPPQTALLVAWADEQTIVIATTEGHLATSSDTGASWTLEPNAIGPVEALSAQHLGDGELEIIVVVDAKVLRTTDGGATTEVLAS